MIVAILFSLFAFGAHASCCGRYPTPCKACPAAWYTTCQGPDGNQEGCGFLGCRIWCNCPKRDYGCGCNNSKACLDCKVGGFSAWSGCSKQCGGGVQWRTRVITQNQKSGGAACPTLRETKACNTQTCNVNCQVSAFGAWGACSKQCGGGVQKRTRRITVNKVANGVACPALEETKACNTQLCDVNCAVGAFGAWGACSKSCGGGEQKRTRAITQPKVANGAACPALEETKDCNENICIKPSLAGDKCKTVEWYKEMCANLFDAGDCKKAGCSFKKDKCVAAKLGKKIKCKKLKTKIEGESICGCFSGCTVKVKKSKKEGRKDKTLCAGVHQFPKPE